MVGILESLDALVVAPLLGLDICSSKRKVHDERGVKRDTFTFPSSHARCVDSACLGVRFDFSLLFSYGGHGGLWGLCCALLPSVGSEVISLVGQEWVGVGFRPIQLPQTTAEVSADFRDFAAAMFCLVCGSDANLEASLVLVQG